MKRLLIFPALFAVGIGVGYWNGFLWPIAVTGWRCVAARADAPGYEPEVL